MRSIFGNVREHAGLQSALPSPAAMEELAMQVLTSVLLSQPVWLMRLRRPQSCGPSPAHSMHSSRPSRALNPQPASALAADGSSEYSGGWRNEQRHGYGVLHQVGS